MRSVSVGIMMLSAESVTFDAVFQYICNCNLKGYVEPVLPVLPMQESEIRGPMMVQVGKEIIDISRPLKFGEEVCMMTV